MNKIALLIPHYNNQTGLLKSVFSIENNVELDIFIVDDGSLKPIDETLVKANFLGNGNIYFIYEKENIGIENVLNKGLQIIKEKKEYKYIARLDCGDICLNERFTKQKHIFETNQDIKLVGSNAVAVSLTNTFLFNTVFPEMHSDIKKKMYLNAMFLHPTIMFNIDILDSVGFYPTKYKAAEDYAYFFSIVNKFKTYNIQEFLVQYEINPDGISITKRKIQVKNRIRIIIKNFYFGFWPFYGLLRNILLYILPYKFILKLKKY